MGSKRSVDAPGFRVVSLTCLYASRNATARNPDVVAGVIVTLVTAGLFYTVLVDASRLAAFAGSGYSELHCLCS
jgi:hypothetical protein